ncbi:hypothetical protein P3L10_031246 [Capsicum annuum]
MDGLKARYHGLVIRDVHNGSYSEVFDTTLRSESYYEIERSNRENKKARNFGGFSGATFGNKSGFNRGQSSLRSQSQIHSGLCFGVDGPCYTCGEIGHITKFCPKGNSGSSQTTAQI